MLHKKLHMPINIPLSTDFKIESGEFDYEIINKFHKFDSLNQKNIKDFLKVILKINFLRSFQIISISFGTK